MSGTVMKAHQLPIAVREETLQVGGFSIRVAVLDNGQRVINADDFDALMSGMFAMSDEDARTLARWVREQK